MRRLASAVLTVSMFLSGALLTAGRPTPAAAVQANPDQSDIVLVLDFSASILDDAANRDRFADALERIADRIDATSADLVAGDTTVSIVQFATRAADYPACVDLELLADAAAVARFADCVRGAATAYRNGPTAALTTRLGDDTNYVAAMTVAERHLPADAVRPALILFTDGKHDVSGVPVSEVQPARDRLFGDRSPFALLPVGMGLSSAERPALESGLASLRIIREMPACLGGAQIEWPQVVFDSPADAGNAVAVALQNVTCTFTVEATPVPTATPEPTPTPAPTPGAPRGIGLTPGDGRIEINWTAPALPPAPIVDYRVRCRSGDGEWTESDEGTSLDTTAVIDGLSNGQAYECEVMAVDETGDGAWIGAPATATPVGIPPAPVKPAVQPLNQAVRIEVPAADPALVTDYRYECSGDGGATWPSAVEVTASGVTAAQVDGLTNGVAYVCRAFAANPAGVSGASVVSDAVRPCGSVTDCNPIVMPVLGIVGAVLLAALLAVLLAFYRDRTRGYVVAVVDVVHSANLGYGSKLGMRFIRDEPGAQVSGVVSDRSRKADIRIRHLGGDRFQVTDRKGRYETSSGEPVIATDSSGLRHQIVLRRFRGATASPTASAR
jgi:hypothetical protein